MRVSCFESFRPSGVASGSRITAAATTSPARQPRPASSVPARGGGRSGGSRHSLDSGRRKMDSAIARGMTVFPHCASRSWMAPAAWTEAFRRRKRCCCSNFSSNSPGRGAIRHEPLDFPQEIFFVDFLLHVFGHKALSGEQIGNRHVIDLDHARSERVAQWREPVANGHRSAQQHGFQAGCARSQNDEIRRGHRLAGIIEQFAIRVGEAAFRNDGCDQFPVLRIRARQQESQFGKFLAPRPRPRPGTPAPCA